MSDICHICKKEKGQPPERCNGHYEKPSALLTRTEREGLARLLVIANDYGTDGTNLTLRQSMPRALATIEAQEKMIQKLLDSAFPNQVDHPTMWAAWKEAAALLEATQ